jgi:phage shock protein A
MNWRFTSGLILGAALALAAGVAAPRKQTRDLSDPETLLQLAQQEMREAQAKNREHAVKTITQKNLLQAEYDKLQKMMLNLEAKEALFQQRGDEEQAHVFAAEREQMKASEASLLTSIQKATETAEAVKANIRREEERIRTKTTQAMALKTAWRQTRIERDLELSYLGRATADVERAFANARKRLEAAQARNALLAQMRSSLDALQAESDQARERGDVDLAQRLQKQCDALAAATVAALRYEP